MSLTNLSFRKETLPQIIPQTKKNQERLLLQNDVVSFNGKIPEKETITNDDNVLNFLLKKIRCIKLSPDGVDRTVQGFFNTTEVKVKIPKNVKIDGKKVKLPDFDNPQDCLKWWNKNIGEAPLSVDPKDKQRARILTKLPSAFKAKLIANLSRPISGKTVKLTVYDNAELIDYRLHLNERRACIKASNAIPTKQGKEAIDTISNIILKKYADDKNGIKYEKKLIVMLGQKAAGKTTLVEEMRNKYGVIVADSDEIRDIIGTAETELHGLLKAQVKDDLADKAIQKGANYLAQFHGTSKRKTIAIIDKFRKEGYSIEIQNIEVPDEELVKRILARKKYSGKDADPLSVILCGWKEQLANFEKIVKKIKKHSHASITARRFNNDVPYGTHPIEINA